MPRLRSAQATPRVSPASRLTASACSAIGWARVGVTAAPAQLRQRVERPTAVAGRGVAGGWPAPVRARRSLPESGRDVPRSETARPTRAARPRWPGVSAPSAARRGGCRARLRGGPARQSRRVRPDVGFTGLGQLQQRGGVPGAVRCSPRPRLPAAPAHTGGSAPAGDSGPRRRARRPAPSTCRPAA